jgi:sec-independent protein translocase protein TatC
MTESEALSGQPLIQHLLELRKRLMICVLGFLIASALSYLVAPQIYGFLVEPLANAYPEGQGQRRLIYTGLAEAFVTYLRLAMFAGFILSFPLIAAQFYMFVAPGLYKKEKHALLPYLIAAPLLFFSGAAFAYYGIFPAAWRFFLGFEGGVGPSNIPIELEAKVADYLSLSTHLITAFGISFQLPIVLVLLVRTGLISLQTLRKGRRYAIVIIVSVAAVITPPDIFSQVALAVPLYGLYEISILLCGRSKKPAKEGEGA